MVRSLGRGWRRLAVWCATRLPIAALTMATPRPPPTFRAFVLRHGQTDANAAGIEQGSADFSRLTELGQRQAGEAIGAFRPPPDDDHEASATPTITRISSVYCSPLTRTRDTLRALEGADDARVVLPSRPATTLQDLREIDLYDWEGQPTQALRVKFPGEVAAFEIGDPVRMRVPETTDGVVQWHYPLVELWKRADKVWDEILREEEKEKEEEAPGFAGGGDRAVLIVAHGNLGQALLGTAMGWGAERFQDHPFANCGIAEIEWGEDPLASIPRPGAARWRWRWPGSPGEWHQIE